jgi:asparagine synthase (glutamine-hydrolysing)
MCGITGILHFGRQADAMHRVKDMAASIAHRGPDDEGFWSDQDVAFGFRRLAILDIETGAQPMCNEDGTVWVVYNGEIYNHRELRCELESSGHRFNTHHSDTEVLVHGWEEWGEALPKKLNGMFVFAIWDQRSRTMVLARDRVGIKPLYAANDGQGNLIFGSEVRAIHAGGLVEKRMHPGGVLEYLTLQNNWFGRTPFAEVRMVSPGTIELHRPQGARVLHFWSLTFTRSNSLSLSQTVEDYRELLLNVMRRQMDADVPVMSYLSGGIDSTAITVAAHRLNRDVRAYSCVFDLTEVGEDRFVDEREYSRTVATASGIQRVELELERNVLISCLDDTIAALEYPRMGMAYVNFLIARRVAEDAKVVLSGMGGDEFHAGYVGRYAITPRDGKLVTGVFNWIVRLLRHGRARPGTSLEAYRRCLNFPIMISELNEALTPEFCRAAADFSPEDAIEDLITSAPSQDPWDVVMYGDCMTYLHGLLVMEDKLSMAHSLETRVPLLDNEIIDSALSLPWEHLCDGKAGKIVFREAVKPWVPENIYAKPKMGFGPPDASWYRGLLRDWIKDQLSAKNISRRGILNSGYVRQKLDNHFSGAENNVALIWSLLSLESWCRIQGF